MNPPDFRGLENFEVVIFLGPSFCEILGGGGGGGGVRAVVVFGIFWPISYNIKNWLFISFIYISQKFDGNLIFSPKIPLIIFMKSLLLCNCLVFYTARLFYILLHATILGVTLKGLVSVCSELSSFSGW